ncbi:hypothetical protein ACN4EK_25090 [Pantanalinema rosaneae CENA516]|uniref:hypothetical protein n=1 Tax=Pantanalinema rosaneae TaxID=1620701 RepID=UPI003D6EA2D6
MQNHSHSRPNLPTSNPTSSNKRLGGYLVEAGLLTPAQIDVALNDQKLTGMRFGEILAARGWVKQQTIEYLMKKVILPEKASSEQRSVPGQVVHPDVLPGVNQSPSLNRRQVSAQGNQPVRREIPISKPLPSINNSDEDVSWVG